HGRADLSRRPVSHYRKYKSASARYPEKSFAVAASHPAPEMDCSSGGHPLVVARLACHRGVATAFGRPKSLVQEKTVKTTNRLPTAPQLVLREHKWCLS